MKIKYQNLITHLQYIPNYFLEYNLSTPENVDAIQLTNFAELEKLRFFNPKLNHWDKMKIPKPFCITFFFFRKRRQLQTKKRHVLALEKLKFQNLIEDTTNQILDYNLVFMT